MKNQIKDTKNEAYEKVSKKYCELIFSPNSLNEKDTKSLKQTLSDMETYNMHVPYEMIAQKIFNCEESKVKVIVDHAKEILNTVNSIDNPRRSEIISSTIRNMELTKVQDKFIDEKTSKANKVLKNIEEQSNKISKMKENIYTDFITILGIFTAITFAIFGEITSVSHAFEKIKDISSIGGTLVSAGISFLLIYGIIIVLFLGISKITHFPAKYSFSRGITMCLISSAVISIVVGALFVIV